MPVIGKTTTTNHQKSWMNKALRAALWLCLVYGAWLMLEASLAYTDPEAARYFMFEKLPLRFETLFLVALYVHVPSALIALPCCLLLVLGWTQRRKRLHRYLGRFTGTLLLFGVVPSGFWLAFTAKGGWPSTVGFLATGAITAFAMVQAIFSARRKDFRAHRRYALHVLGQLGVAVASRMLLVVADRFALEPTAAYLVALWGPVVGAVIIVELMTRPKRRKGEGVADEEVTSGSDVQPGFAVGLGERPTSA